MLIISNLKHQNQGIINSESLSSYFIIIRMKKND